MIRHRRLSKFIEVGGFIVLIAFTSLWVLDGGDSAKALRFFTSDWSTPKPPPPNTPTPAVPIVTSIIDRLNIRSGPGIRYDIIGSLDMNEQARIVGKVNGVNWWKIDCPSDVRGKECWVSSLSKYTSTQRLK